MLNLYSAKRREPRLRLRTQVLLVGTDVAGCSFADESLTIDVSPHGASVLVDRELAIGASMEFHVRRDSFATRAIVRSVHLDRSTGSTAVGLEFVDSVSNPLVGMKTEASELISGQE